MATDDDPPVRTHEAHDRLTRLCEAMTDAMRAHPECGDVQCIVMLDSASEGRGGLVMDGYESDAEAIAALLFHVRVIFRANGSDLQIVPISNG